MDRFIMSAEELTEIIEEAVQKANDHVYLAIRKNRHGLGGDVGIKLVSDSVFCNFSEMEADNDLQ